MKYEIQSVEIWSVGRTVFLISLVVHLILGTGVLLIILIGMNIGTSFLNDTVYYDDEMDSFGVLIGIVLLIVLSVSASIFYSVVYMAFVAFYNIISPRLGGIEITVEELSKTTKTVLIPKSEDAIEEDSSEE